MNKNCSFKGLDCLGNKINQLGVNNTNIPSLSELAFNNRFSVGKNTQLGGEDNCECKDCDCEPSECYGDCECCSEDLTGGYESDCGCSASDKEGGGYYIGVENNKVGGLSEIVPYFDCNKPTYAPKSASNPVTPNFSKVQKAGSVLYQYIINPITGRKVNINGKIGKKVLLSYLQQTGGVRSLNTAFNGPESVFDPNMNNREFGCRQPQWEPKCV